MRIYIVCTVLFTLLVSSIFTKEVFAQTEVQFGFANTYRINDEFVDDGDIISLSHTVSTDENGVETQGPAILQRSSTSYDDSIFGIYVENPTVVLRTPDTEALPVVREGDAYVNVTTISGPIEKGDPITSSSIPGKGQQAKGISGIIVGIALDPFSEGDGEPFLLDDGTQVAQGQVRVALSIGEVQPLTVVSRGGIIGLVSQLGLSILQSLDNEGGSKILRYMIAGLVAIITVLVSFFTFGRNVTKGIEAIGRNPVAKIQIQSMIVLNVFLIAFVTIGGIILTLILIRF